ncbi:hypothetical protein DBR42_01560 [Pelomonas sp. HMWF004]|nr:hypothetical protein DBR42_01560 [Pelomonas sp. HMWF004]
MFMRRFAAAPLLLALLAGCAGVLDQPREARDPQSSRTPRDLRMAQSSSVAGVAEERFAKFGWGRQGEFMLSGQRVRYERGADRLALFEPLPGGVRNPLRFNWASPAGDSAAVCDGWTLEPTANSRLTDAKPWVLSCRWAVP